MFDRRTNTGIFVFLGLLFACFFLAFLIVTGESVESAPDGPRIGVVRVDGLISDSLAQRGLDALRQLRRDEDIKAIVVRIESPGGLVGPSQELYREIRKTMKVKPVVASLGSVAASGGYYVASACQRIMANPGTITGSIGVITQSTHVQELLALARIESHTFKSGRFKDTGSPLRTMDEDEKVFMQGFINGIQSQFVGDVARGRRLTEAQVRKVADGRVLTGSEARGHRLLDELGNFSDALELAARLAKAEGEPVPVELEQPRGLLSDLLSEAIDSRGDTLVEKLLHAMRPRTTVEVRDPSISPGP